MSTLLIITAFVLSFIGGANYGRIIGARNMAGTIIKIGTEKYGKEFKDTIGLGMIKEINKLRADSGKEPLKFVKIGD